MNDIIFFVEGQPIAKQSFKVGRVGGRVSGFTPARVKSWQSSVGTIAQLRMRSNGLLEPLAENLLVRLTFFLQDARRVDSDNLSKCVLDGMNNVVWNDDKQVVDLVITKFICRERQGVLIQVYPNPRRMEISLDEMDIFSALAVPELIGARAIEAGAGQGR
jgi:Holliday junction resolvase RusA-like endonuclease